MEIRIKILFTPITDCFILNIPVNSSLPPSGSLPTFIPSFLIHSRIHLTPTVGITYAGLMIASKFKKMNEIVVPKGDPHHLSDRKKKYLNYKIL